MALRYSSFFRLYTLLSIDSAHLRSRESSGPAGLVLIVSYRVSSVPHPVSMQLRAAVLPDAKLARVPAVPGWYLTK